jgi:hypothetical protein
MPSLKTMIRSFLGLEEDREEIKDIIRFELQNIRTTASRTHDLFRDVFCALERGQKVINPDDPTVKAESDRLGKETIDRLVAEYKARKHTEDGSY